jgi:hypothetical protein
MIKGASANTSISQCATNDTASRPPPLARSGSGASTQDSHSENDEKAAELNRTTDNSKILTRSSSSRVGLDVMIEEHRETGALCQNVVRFEVPFGKPIEEVYEGVHDGPELGSGFSGVVRLVTHRATGLKYAVKVLDLARVESGEGLTRLREEISVMCEVRNLVQVTALKFQLVSK